MMGAEAADMLQSLLERADDLDRHDKGIVFRRPVFVTGSSHDADLAGFIITAQFDAVRFHDWGQLLEEGSGHIAVDQIGILIDVDVADAAPRFDAGDGCRIDDHADQAGTAAGNGQIDIAAQGQ